MGGGGGGEGCRAVTCRYLIKLSINWASEAGLFAMAMPLAAPPPRTNPNFSGLDRIGAYSCVDAESHENYLGPTPDTIGYRGLSARSEYNCWIDLP